MMAHSAESSQSVKMGLKAPSGWRNGTNPRVTSSIAAQWLTPTISALLLLSANVQHSHLYQSDTETCLPTTNILPISVETAQLCAQQEDTLNYITSIMNNPNYSIIHNQAAINTYKEKALNNTAAIANETSKIVEKIYNILLGSLNPTNQSLEMKNYNLSFSYIVSKLHRRRSVNENSNAFTQFSNMSNKPDENYNNEEEDQTYYRTSNEDYGNKDTLIYEYPNYIVPDADVSAATETLYYDLHTNEAVTDESTTDFMPSTHDQQNQQFKNSTKTADMAEITHIHNSSSPSQAPQQTEINFPTVQFKISPTTSQSLLIANDISATSTTEESIMPVAAGPDSNNYLSLLYTETEAIPQTSPAGEELVTIVTTHNEFTFQQQTNRSTESATESQTTTRLKSSTESQITPQSEGGVIHVQVPETVNLCVVKCYFSGSFLKNYLFALLFLCYFVPVLAAVMICVATDKNLTMIQSHKVEPTEEPTTTNQENASETACHMHIARMVLTCKTVKHIITTSTLLWTPTFIETLLRVWFCIDTPEWLTTLLFVLGQVNIIIRNALNVRMITGLSCSGRVQPLEAEEGKANSNSPTKLFTKIKAAFL
jgi:hypothetical protein